MGTSVVDIYGHITDKSEIILGVGNYNNVHGLLTYFAHENLLQIRPLDELIVPSVISLMLQHEIPSKLSVKNRIYFSLAIKGINKYINVTSDDGEKNTVCASVSENKRIFWIDYSSIDNIPRSQLLAGALYSLQTTIDNHDYIVSWKIRGFSNGDLITFLPTIWYESKQDFCEMKNGALKLIQSLQQIQFKGYTTQQWCEAVSKVSHCSIDKYCGDCLGPCPDPNHICYPSLRNNKFICGPPELEPKLNEMVTFNEPESNTTIYIAITIVLLTTIICFWVLYH